MKLIYIDEDGLFWEVIKKDNKTYLECLDIPARMSIGEVKRMNVAILVADNMHKDRR